MSGTVDVVDTPAEGACDCNLYPRQIVFASLRESYLLYVTISCGRGYHRFILKVKVSLAGGKKRTRYLSVPALDWWEMQGQWLMAVWCGIMR